MDRLILQQGDGCARSSATHAFRSVPDFTIQNSKLCRVGNLIYLQIQLRARGRYACYRNRKFRHHDCMISYFSLDCLLSSAFTTRQDSRHVGDQETQSCDTQVQRPASPMVDFTGLFITPKHHKTYLLAPYCETCAQRPAHIVGHHGLSVSPSDLSLCVNTRAPGTYLGTSKFKVMELGTRHAATISILMLFVCGDVQLDPDPVPTHANA